MNDESQDNGLRERLDTWRDSAWIAKVAIRNRWAVPVMILLGLAAALAEALGVGLAVVFLFALLGQSDDVIEGGGLLASLMAHLEAVVGPNPVVLAGVFFIIILTKAMLTYVNEMVTAQTLNQIAQQVRDRLHRNYVTVSYIFLQKRDTGDLLNTLATESWGVADAFYSLSRIGVHLSAAAIFLVGMFALSWTIALTSIACAVLVFAFLRLLSRPVQRLGREMLAANQILAERMLVSLNGTRTIRAFATEGRMLRRFDEISERVKRLAIRRERFKALLGPIGEVAGLGTLIVVALVANYAGIAIPTVIASVLLLFRLQPHLHQFEENRLVLTNMGASIRNVREMLEVDNKPFPKEGTQQLEENEPETKSIRLIVHRFISSGQTKMLQNAAK